MALTLQPSTIFRRAGQSSPRDTLAASRSHGILMVCGMRFTQRARHHPPDMTRRTLATVPALLLALIAAGTGAQPRAGRDNTVPTTRPRTKNVILVMTDGFRWQELFGGAQAEYIGPAGNVSDTNAIKRDFLRASAEERRRVLMPFFWDSIATQGQVFGDSTAGSLALITNGYKFSYPGYSETFTGHADDRIDSNAYPPNPNTTVFEWLNSQREFRGRVAAFATWDAFTRIFNAPRSGIPVHDGWDPARAVAATGTPQAAVLRALYATSSRLWNDVAWDALMQQALLDDWRVTKPRVLFVGYGETDEWAHSGRYDQYLRAAHQVDAFIAELWKTVQRDPAYRGTTTLIVTTDHGRGTGREWRDHGKSVNGAERIWMAVMGPDTPPLGVRRGIATVRQAQVAATIAALLGRDWNAAEPRAAAVLPDILR